MPRFEPHGDAQMDVQGHVLCVRPQSPGNVEEMQRLLDGIAEILPTLAGATWGALLIGNSESLLTPDAEALLKRSAPGLVTSGQRAMAIAVTDGAPGYIIRAQFSRAYEDTACVVEVFRAEGEARAWLGEALRQP